MQRGLYFHLEVIMRPGNQFVVYSSCEEKGEENHDVLHLLEFRYASSS
jgi:hypothetical protein